MNQNIDKELLERIYNTFEPLNEDEQKLVFFSLIDSYLQCCATLENDELTETQAEVITVQQRAYNMYMGMFAKTNPKFKYDIKKYMFEEIEKCRTELLEKVDGNS